MNTLVLLCFVLLFLPTSVLYAQSGLDFDGVDDKATVLHHADFDFGNGNFTIEAHVSNLGLGSDLTILSKRDDRNNGFILFLNTISHEATIRLENQNRTISDPRIAPGNCFHLAVKRNNSNNIIFCIDSTIINAGSSNKNINSPADLFFGKDGITGNGSKQPFLGTIEEIRIWSNARSNANILANVNACLTGTHPNLVAYWNIEEGSGQFLHDVAGNGHHAYLGNSFFADSEDGVFAASACLASCCGVQAGFVASQTDPRAFQTTFFTNTTVGTATYEWFVNDSLESTSTDFQCAFSIGVHHVLLIATDGSGCRSFASTIIEVTQLPDNCGAPLNVRVCDSGSVTMQILDRFGNCYDPEELGQSISGTSRLATNHTQECGIFTLYFQDVELGTGEGFDDPSLTSYNNVFVGTLGEERQAIVCRVFEDLTRLIGANSTLTLNDLRIYIDRSDADGLMELLPSSTLGSGSSYYWELGSPNVHKFALGEAGKTIISGRDSYENLNIQTPAISPNMPHGVIKFNFIDFSFPSPGLASNWSNGNIATGLYPVALHEAIHVLGFASALVESPVGNYFSTHSNSNRNNLYHSWDQFLEQGAGTVMGVNPGANGVITITAPNAISSCPTLSFDYGVATPNNHPVFYTGAYMQGSSFSHYNCALAPTPGFVMNAATSPFALHPNEVEALCKLGYPISGMYGHNRTGSNQSTTERFYSPCARVCNTIGAIDIISPTTGQIFEVNRTIVDNTYNTVTISFFDIGNNDFNSTGETGFQVLQGGGGVTNTTTDFTYTPDLAFTGWAILSYVPICPDGNLGELTYIYIWVAAGPYPTCNQSASDCNLVCNGDFEAFIPALQIVNGQLDNFLCNYTNAPSALLVRRRDLLNISSVDVIDYPTSGPLTTLNPLRNQINWYKGFFQAGGVARANCFQGTAITTADLPQPLGFPNETQYVGLGTWSQGPSLFSEYMYLQLSQALVNVPTTSTTNNYRLRFWVHTHCTDFDLRFVFGSGEICPIQATGIGDTDRCDLRGDNAPAYEPAWLASPPNPTAFNQCAAWGDRTSHHNLRVPILNPSQNQAGFQQGFWVTQDFSVNTPGLDRLIIHIDAFDPANGAYVIMDNISITPIDITEIDIAPTLLTSTCPCSEAIIEYVITNPSPVALTGVVLDANFGQGTPPNNLTFVAGGGFDATGIATVNIPANGSVTVQLHLDLACEPLVQLNVPNIITLDIASPGVCAAGNTNQTSFTIEDTPSDLVITTTVLNLGTTSIQYEITVENPGTTDVTGIVLDIPQVPGLFFTFPQATFNLLAGTDITFIVDAQITTCVSMKVGLCAIVSEAVPGCGFPILGCSGGVQLPGLPDITITKSISQSPIEAGESTDFIIDIRSNCQDQNGIVISDILPPGLLLTGLPGLNWTFNPFTREISCTPFNMTAGSVQTFIFRVTAISDGQCDNSLTLSNTATATVAGQTFFSNTVNLTIEEQTPACTPSTMSITFQNAIDAGTLPDFIMTNGTVVINGTWRLSPGATYTFGLGAIVIMEPGAQIIVSKGAKLTLDGATLRGCTCLWHRILVEPTGTLITQNSTQIAQNNTRIRDAQYGIQAMNGAILSIERTFFTNNFIGLYVAPNSIGQTINLLAFDNNNFSALNILRPFIGIQTTPSLTQAQTPINIATPTVPPFGAVNMMGLAGIYVWDIISLDLSPAAPHNRNRFTRMVAGIVALNTTSLIVNTCQFASMVRSTSYSNNLAFQACGIHSQGKIGELEVTGLVSNPLQPFNNNNNIATFQNCELGISALNLEQLRVFNCGMRNISQIGVRATLCQKLARVQSSKMTNVNGIGIGFFFCKKADLSANLNSIEVQTLPNMLPAFDAGIVVQESPLAPSTSFSIINNTLTNRDGSGIIVFGHTGTSASIPGVINNNHIAINGNSPERAGIAIALSRVNMSCNEIDGNQQAQSTNATYGIFGALVSQGLWECNIMNQTQTGVFFIGNNDVDLQGTEFNAHQTGLWLDGSNGAITTIGDQKLMGNRWLGTTTADAENFSPQSSWQFSRFFIAANAPSPFVPNTWTNNFAYQQFWLFPGGAGTDVICTNPNCTLTTPAALIQNPSINTQDISLANNTFPAFPNPTSAYFGKRQLYRKLIENPSLVQADPSLPSFVPNHQGGCIGHFDNIQESVKQIFTLSYADSIQIDSFQNVSEYYLDSLACLDSMLYANYDTITRNLRTDLAANFGNAIQQHQTFLTNLHANQQASLLPVQTVNSSFTTAVLHEDLEKQVNEIYLRTFAIGIADFTATQLSILQTIAAYCPQEGGAAVYQARGMLSMFQDVEILNLDCTHNQAKKAEGNTNVVDDFAVWEVLLFPNPTNKELTIQSNLLLEDNSSIEIYNSLGQNVKVISTNKDTQTVQIDVSHLLDGIYFMRLKNGESIITKSFIVSK